MGGKCSYLTVLKTLLLVPDNLKTNLPTRGLQICWTLCTFRTYLELPPSFVTPPHRDPLRFVLSSRSRAHRTMLTGLYSIRLTFRYCPVPIEGYTTKRNFGKNSLRYGLFLSFRSQETKAQRLIYFSELAQLARNWTVTVIQLVGFQSPCSWPELG